MSQNPSIHRLAEFQTEQSKTLVDESMEKLTPSVLNLEVEPTQKLEGKEDTKLSEKLKSRQNSGKKRKRRLSTIIEPFQISGRFKKRIGKNG